MPVIRFRAGRHSLLIKNKVKPCTILSPSPATGSFLFPAPPLTSRGFTLIELVTTIVILGILSVSVIVKWPGQALTLDGQASQLVSDIRYVQAISMTREQRYRINFASDHYWLSNQDDTTTVNLPLSGQSQVDMQNGITLAATDSYLVFGKDGTPYTDAVTPGTPLATDAVITLSSGTDSKTVTISPETGRVIAQ